MPGSPGSFPPVRCPSSTLSGSPPRNTGTSKGIPTELPSPLPASSAQVQVVMLKDVVTGEWRRHAEWTDAALGASSGTGQTGQPKFHTPRSRQTLEDSTGDLSENKGQLPAHSPRRPNTSQQSSPGRPNPSWSSFGIAPRPSNEPVPRDSAAVSARGGYNSLLEEFTGSPRRSGESVPRLSPRQQRNRQQKESERAGAAVKRLLDSFDHHIETNYPPSSLVEVPSDLKDTLSMTFGSFHRRSTAGFGSSPDTLQAGKPSPSKPGGGPSLYGRGAKFVHPLVGLLCSHTPPEIVAAYREFCLVHTMPTLFGVQTPAGVGNLSTATNPDFSRDPEMSGGIDAMTPMSHSAFGGALVSPLSAAVSSSTFATPVDLMKKMESGWFFYVHPDGLTAAQFKYLLPHFAEKSGVTIGSEFATQMFRKMCRENSHKLPFCDILALVGESLVPPKVHQNIDFLLQCFDPYNTGRVPNHMFYSSFFSKFLHGERTPVPTNCVPQWGLLLDTLKALESSSLADGSLPAPRTAGRKGNQSGMGARNAVLVTEEEREHFAWLRTTYLNAHNNYKVFNEKMSLMLSTIRAKLRQGGTEAISGVFPSSPQHTGTPSALASSSSGAELNSSMAGFGASGPTPGAVNPRGYPSTMGVPYAEARVVLLGTPSLCNVLSNNSLIFFATKASATASTSGGVGESSQQSVRAELAPEEHVPVAQSTDRGDNVQAAAIPALALDMSGLDF